MKALSLILLFAMITISPSIPKRKYGMKLRNRRLKDYRGGPTPGLECLYTGDFMPRLPDMNG